jgi:hypothetical protein
VVVPYSTQYSTSPPVSLMTLPNTAARVPETPYGVPVMPVAQPEHTAVPSRTRAISARLPMNARLRP